MGRLRNSILGAAAGAALFFSTEAQAEQKQAPEDKPVPPVPANVLKQGGDAVLQWMFDNNCVSLEYLQRFTEEKARAASGGKEGAENGGESPLLGKFKADFETLPTNAFKSGPKPKWEQVAAKLTPEVLAKTANLEMPRIYGVNGNGELLIGDGGREVPAATLGKNYSEARGAVIGQGLGLMTRAEYVDFNVAQMEVNLTTTWLESGETPSLALFGGWNGYVRVGRYDPGNSDEILGTRRVHRVKL